MTYLVGYSPHKDDTSALDLACQLGRSEMDKVHAVTVVPKGWETAAGSHTDRDFAAWAQAEGEASAAEALAVLGEHPNVDGSASWVTGRSVPAALLECTRTSGASVVVVGSGAHGPVGRLTVTPKTDRLLHSSDVPIAIAPRGYRAAEDSRITRVTVAFRDDDATWRLLDRVAEICRHTGSQLRLVTFAIRHRAMVTTTVSGAEDLVFEQVRRQARAAQQEAVQHLTGAGFAETELDAVIAEGRSWEDAMAMVPWTGGDILVVGSSSTHRLAQVFLGSSAAKIIRSSPVPAIVVP